MLSMISFCVIAAA